VSIVLIGTNYRHAGLALRERLASHPDHVQNLLHQLKTAFPNTETVVISTCNRFEVYLCRSSHQRPDSADILSLLAQSSELEISSLENAFYCYRNEQAVKHLFQVACAMDSMLVGEPQIMGQVRHALDEARNVGTAGTYLTRLFQDSLSLAKRVRQTADIAEGHFSLGSIAAEFADKIIGSLSEKTFLVLGAGKMGTGALGRLVANGAKDIFIANRDLVKARQLASSLPLAQAIEWDRVDECLTRANVVISCLAACEPVLTLDRIEKVSATRSGWPMLIIDLGLPRNVDPRIGQLSWVHLYDLDALGSVLDKNNDHRRQKLAACREIIDQAIIAYQNWQQQRTVIPAIVGLRKKIHQIGQEELARLAMREDAFTPEQWAIVEKAVHRMIHKILHDPTAAMNQAASESRGAVYAGILQKLFDLPSTAEPITGESVKAIAPQLSQPILNHLD
jgi:glutamyl-tRNA reductase